MREITVSLGGEEVTLAANFKAGEEIAAKVVDPFLVFREAAIEQMLASVGQHYRDPKFEFTLRNVPAILHIGMKCAGSERTLDEVKDMCFDAGLVAAKAAAIDYLMIFAAPKSDEVDPGRKADAAAEK